MKRLLLLVPLAAILYACPFESTVPLEPAPIEPVDTSLYGYWYGIIKDGSDFFGIEALEITRHSDSQYSIIRYGKAMKGDMILPDTAYFTGFTSRVNDKQFMNVEGSIVLITSRKNKAPEVKTQKVYYISYLERRNDTLRVKTVTDNFSPLARKGFRTPQDLKSEISLLLSQNANIYDNEYSLSYRKIEKPRPLKPF